MRKDFGDIIDMYSEFILGIPTNATRALQHAKRLAGKVAYVNVGLEGPRAITQRVRGDYDKIMAGIRVFQEHGLPLSLSCVVLRSDLHGLPFTYQIADTIDAGKLKLIMPLRKGNAPDLFEALGNVLEEPISEIWNRYRFKRNHVSKYLGASIHTTVRGGGHA